MEKGDARLAYDDGEPELWIGPKYHHPIVVYDNPVYVSCVVCQKEVPKVWRHPNPLAGCTFCSLNDNLVVLHNDFIEPQGECVEVYELIGDKWTQMFLP